MYSDETVLVLNNPTLLKTLWRPLDVCSWLVYFGDGMLSRVTSLSDTPRLQYYDVQTWNTGILASCL
jgi:hypothetical protein